MKILRYGERAVLLEVGAARVNDYAAAIERLDDHDIVSIVPAAETVLVQARHSSAIGGLSFRLETIEPLQRAEYVTDPVVIDARYDGEDLERVAVESGLGVDEVISAHSDVDYRVQFCGFSPGFAYLSGLDPLLQLPRRASPRTRVPAGSIAIAGPYTAVYPTASPGGWHLLGCTDAVLFDAHRFEEGRSPALLEPGQTVRFRPV
ncbi:MAG: allophanate hydrolase subunit 1 [Actinomycetota bacterium]|nr:allophanate hydrolase subunit 1 [Actinomycetota bacterium]